jgi:hypothetical protein
MFLILKKFWKSFGVVLTWLGVLYLPADIFSSIEAVSGWRRVFAMADQNTALVIFSAFLVAYIVWIDARPFFIGWRDRRKTGLKVLPQISWRSGLGEEFDGTMYYTNVAALVVYNDSTDGQTIFGVKVRGGGLEVKDLTDRMTSKTQVDIQSGDHAEFVIGSVVALRMFGLPDSSIKMTEYDIIDAKNNVGQGHRTLRTDSSGIVLLMSEPHVKAPQTRTLTLPRFRVTARDVRPINVQLTMDLKAISSVEHVQEAPLTAQVVD